MDYIGNAIISIIVFGVIVYFLGFLITAIFLLYLSKDIKNAEKTLAKNVRNNKIPLNQAGIVLALMINGGATEWPWYWYRRLKIKLKIKK
ncbi:MAG: hypothetical protein PHY72_03765 [Candidatus Pacebacteria bacterium]|nr:hypothetical protein [Candidatus Paceibacterota bacterium]